MSTLLDAICNKCCNPASMMCQRCHETYCSAECQILDWRDHKSKCHQMPNLVPIRKLQLRSGRTSNSAPNESMQLEVQSIMRLAHNRSSDQSRHNRGEIGGNDTSNHRSMARNPLPLAKNDASKAKPLLEDKDFTLKPKISESFALSNSKGAIPKKSSSVAAMDDASLDAPWKIPFAPPQGKFFEAIIQWFDREADPRFLWVTELKYDTPLRKLMVDINRSLKKEILASPTELEMKVGALVAAPLEDIFYRAEVLEINNVKRLAKVRLIDYGNELLLDYKELRSPIPIMRNLNAYAMRVRLPEDSLGSDWKVESVVSIRVLSVESLTSGDEVHYIELKTQSIPLHLPLDSLAGNPEMLLKKVFIGGQKALLQFETFDSFDENINAQLSSEKGKNFNFSEDQQFAEGSFLAARTSKGWRRGSFLGYCPQKNIYLVYLLDEGQIEMCKEVKKIPDNFLNKPMRIIAITVSSTQILLDETQLITAGKLSLRALATSPPSPHKSVQILPCALYANAVKVCDVVASSFSGMLSSMNVKCWTDRLNDGELVYITHVVTQAEVFITPISCMVYSEIFTSMAGNCTAYGADENIKDDIVLAAVSKKTKYFRAKVLDGFQSGSDSSSLLKVLDIDNGCCCEVPQELIRKPNLFVRSCPVYVQKMKLLYIDKISTPIKDNKAITTLQRCKENCIEFVLKLVTGESETADLVLKTDHQQSLSKKLLPLLFEENLNGVQSKNESNKVFNKITSPTFGSASLAAHETPLPPSPPDTPIIKRPSLSFDAPTSAIALPNLNLEEDIVKIYTLDDVDIVPIPNGEKVPLSVLDASTVSKGYITAADCSNEAALKQIEQNLDKVKKYGKCPHLQRNYEPKVNEICLTLFDDDDEWYRALCVNITQDGKFHIMFLDFGNMCFVTKESILPITKDLLFASNANLCIIENFPPNLTKSHLMGFVKSTSSNPIIQSQVKRQEDDTYKIKIHGIEKYFAQ